ncbi:hypothetical protein OTU49_011482, partial [Cherax quadricarinatus]
EREEEAKRARVDIVVQEARARSPASPGEACSSSWGRVRVKKERADTSDTVPEDLRGSVSPSRYGGRLREEGGEEGAGLSKDIVQQLVSSGSSRITLSEKDAAGSHYISDVWCGPLQHASIATRWSPTPSTAAREACCDTVAQLLTSTPDILTMLCLPRKGTRDWVTLRRPQCAPTPQLPPTPPSLTRLKDHRSA